MTVGKPIHIDLQVKTSKSIAIGIAIKYPTIAPKEPQENKTDFRPHEQGQQKYGTKNPKGYTQMPRELIGNIR